LSAVARLRRAVRPRSRLRELRQRRAHRRLAGARLLRGFAARYPRAFFVEIGANDGQQHDPLRELILSRDWRGIMVEPVPFVFERLRRNYAGLGRVALENVAIADRVGTRPFYHLAEAAPEERAALPGWYDGIGSFSRGAVLEHGRDIPGIDERLVRTEVPCLTLEALLERHAVDRVDLLLVDAEGYDWEILRRTDLESIRPRLVIYEHYHLAQEDRELARTRLTAAGYECKEEGFDTFCVDARIQDALLRAWRRLRPVEPGISAGADG
jgi:FkbM family methyltransferase